VAGGFNVSKTWGMSDSNENQVFKKCAKSIQLDISYSKILFQFDWKRESLDKAREIIGNWGIKIVNTKIFDFPKDSISIALFKLDISYVKQVVLVLLEQGFAPIKEYNARPLKD